MKTVLRKIFGPILTVFESSEEILAYKPSHRKVLITVGVLFSGLTLALCVIGLRQEGYGFLLPALIFGGIGLVTLVVGCLGTDQAVARIWGSQR